MLIINPASAGSARYWERSAVYSTWLGRGAPLLGLSGPVDVADLRAVMRGLGPDRLPLTSRPGLRQRQGWDLVFAAPKSVSLLAGTAPASSAEPLRSAFRGAVADAVSVLEKRAAWLRSGGEQVAARGVVAASFEHMANDAGHPHLHAHLVLANIGAKADQGWGCLVSNELWRWREALGAGFHLALRSRITEAGFGFRWELTNGGLGEIVSVPLRARAVASSRSLGLRAGVRLGRPRAPRSAPRRARLVKPASVAARWAAALSRLLAQRAGARTRPWRFCGMLAGGRHCRRHQRPGRPSPEHLPLVARCSGSQMCWSRWPRPRQAATTCARQQIGPAGGASRAVGWKWRPSRHDAGRPCSPMRSTGGCWTWRAKRVSLTSLR